MKRWIINVILLSILGITFMMIGVYFFDLSMKVTEIPIKIFGFVLTSGFLIISVIIIVFISRYIQGHEQKKLNSEKTKFEILFEKEFKKWTNFFIFSLILVMFLLNFLLFGIVFLPSNEEYWRLLDAIIAITMAMLISYMPWFDRLKKKIWTTSWIYLFIIAFISILSVIFLYSLLISS